MNVEFLPSHLLSAVRERLKPFREKGVKLRPDEVRSILEQLKFIQELSQENEEEVAILERRLHLELNLQRHNASRDQRIEIDAADNVVQLPVKRRPHFVAVTPDGGDAA